MGGHSIAETTYLRLGGIPQWVMFRGQSVANPPLVLLHGGPGLPEMRFFRRFNSSLEESFTVVYWQQRGAGRSFDRGIPRSSMTVEQFLADLDELVDAVRTRFGQERVAIYGHSWGSALGVLYAARFPGKVSVYVGAAQLGDWPASERSSYAFTVVEAERRGSRKALRELLAIGPPPHTSHKMLVQRRWLARFVGVARGMSPWQFLGITLGGPESSLLDLPRIVRGLQFSVHAMWAEVSALDLEKIVPSLHLPVFFFLGRHDHVVASETSVAYFEKLVAPSKQLVWFEESAHEPAVEEPEKFNAAMVERVRPLAG